MMENCTILATFKAFTWPEGMRRPEEVACMRQENGTYSVRLRELKTEGTTVVSHANAPEEALRYALVGWAHVMVKEQALAPKAALAVEAQANVLMN